MTDIAWWRRRKDPYEAFIQPRLDEMFRIACRFCDSREDAEDLLQDVVIKLAPRVEELLQLQQPGPWLAKVIYRQFIDMKRQQLRQRTLSLSVVGDLSEQDTAVGAHTDPQPDPATTKFHSQVQGLVATALASLTPDQRALVVLADMEELPLADVAQILDIPVGTVKSRLHRTRALLRQRLEKKIEPDMVIDRVKG